MAGEYYLAKSKKEILKMLKPTVPYGAKIFIDKPIKTLKGKKYYTIVDVFNKEKKLLYHN